MKLFLFSDTHITPNAEFSTPSESGLTTYLDRVVATFDWLYDCILEQQPDVVAMLGDLFETTGFVDTLSLSVASKACSDIASACNNVGAYLLFVVGNHDMYNGAYHNLEFLTLESGIHVIDKPSVLKLGSEVLRGEEKQTVYVYPYTDDPEFKIDQGPGVVLSHVNVVGGLFNHKKASTTGVNPSLIKDCICFNGHHHHYQRVSNNFVNVGSLLSRSFKDVGSPEKGAILTEIGESGKLVSMQRLINPHEVPYVDIDLTSAAAISTWKTKVDELDFSGVEGKYVRLKASPEAAQLASVVQDIALGCRSEVVKESATDQQLLDISDKFSPEENFKQYVDDVMMFDKPGDRAAYLEAGLEYIHRVEAEQHFTTKPVTFCDVSIQNFQAVKSAELDLQDPRIVLIKGDNGAGKSTLSEAIYWLITGKSLRGNTGDEVIHWAEKDCCVTGHILVGASRYRITRSKTKGKPQRVKLEKQNHHEDYVDISARKAKDTSEMIHKLLGRSNEILEQSVFLSSDLKTKFTSLSYPDRVNLLEDITNSKVYRAVYDSLKKDIAKTERDLHTLFGSKESTARYYESTKEKLKKANGELVEFSRNAVMRAEQIRLQIQATKSSLQEAQQTLTSYQTSAEISDDLSSEISSLDLKRVKLTSTIDLLEQEMSQESRKVVRAQELIKKGVCPTCYSELTAESLPSSLRDEISEAKRNIAECKSRASLLDSSLKSIDSAVSELRIKRSKLLQERNTKERQRKEAENRVSNLKQDLVSLKHDLLSCSNADPLKNVIASLKEQALEYKQNLEDCEQAVAQAEEDIRKLNWLYDAFSTRGLRASVLSNFTVPFLNSKLEEYSRIFGLPCSLVTEVETKAGDVQSKIDVMPHDERTYRSCSRGEKRRIDLAVQCALSDLATATAGASVNLIVGDEIIDPLDRRGVETFLDILKSKESATVLLTSHNVYADTFADTTINVVQENKYARVVGA